MTWFQTRQTNNPSPVPELYLRFKLGEIYHRPYWEVSEWPTHEYLTLLELMDLDHRLEKAFPWDPQE